MKNNAGYSSATERARSRTAIHYYEIALGGIYDAAAEMLNGRDAALVNEHLGRSQSALKFLSENPRVTDALRTARPQTRGIAVDVLNFRMTGFYGSRRGRDIFDNIRTKTNEELTLIRSLKPKKESSAWNL